MNQWNFVFAAYAVVTVGTLGLLLATARAMRKAERSVLDQEQ
jgi:hypothetical protein